MISQVVNAPPPYFANILPLLKQRHINQCMEIWLKYVHSSGDIGNHRYTNVQNCILLKNKFDFFLNPPPQSKNRSYGIENCCSYMRTLRRPDVTIVFEMRVILVGMDKRSKHN